MDSKRIRNDLKPKPRILFVLPGSETSSGPCKSMIRLAELIHADYFSFKGHYQGMSKAKLLWHSPKWIYSLLKTIRKYDLIITYSPSSGTYLSILFSKFSIVHLGGLPEERKRTIKRRLFLDTPLNYTLKHCKQVWYNDDSFVEQYAKTYNQNSVMIKNAIDLKKFYPDENARRERRLELGLTDRDFVLGIVGPFDPVYNLPGLTWLLEQELNRKIKLVIIGVSGFDMMNPNHIYLSKLDEKEYVNTLRTLDCLVVPRFVKTFCPQSKVLEAMACSVTVIQTRNSTVPLGSVDGKSIFVTTKPNQNMINIVNGLSERPFDCRKVGIAATKVIEENYNQADTQIEMFRAILSLGYSLSSDQPEDVSSVSTCSN